MCVAVILSFTVLGDTSPHECVCGPRLQDMTEHGASATTTNYTGTRGRERQGEEDGATADASSSLQHTDANRDDSAMRC